METTAASLRPNEQQTSHLNTLGDQAQMVRENDKVRENRQVENTDDTTKSKMKLDGETTTDTSVVDKKVITEKYNSDGELVNVVPPDYAKFI